MTRHNAPRVLVVDDDPGILAGLATSLEDRGAAVTAAEDLRGAREALGNGSFDLVLTDLCLEGGTEGLEVAATARKAGPSTRIVLFTGRDLAPALERAQEAGVDEILPKPFPSEVLDRLLADLGTASEPEPTASSRKRLTDSEGQKLLQRFVAGDRASFDRLVDAYTPMLFGIFLKWFNLTVEDAEDLYQEVLLQLLVKAGSIRNVRLWLVGTAVNQAKKRIRHLIRDRNLVSRYLEESSLSDGGGEDDAEGVRDLIAKGLSLLKPSDQELLRLIYLEELSYKEVARRLGRPIGSIGPQRGRALKRLMQAVATLEQRPTAPAGAAAM
jgi:RNA polymerase sigma factor (sigma-70 family)